MVPSPKKSSPEKSIAHAAVEAGDYSRYMPNLRINKTGNAPRTAHAGEARKKCFFRGHQESALRSHEQRGIAGSGSVVSNALTDSEIVSG